jgi:hypothetical protein
MPASRTTGQSFCTQRGGRFIVELISDEIGHWPLE